LEPYQVEVSFWNRIRKDYGLGSGTILGMLEPYQVEVSFGNRIRKDHGLGSGTIL